MIYLDYNATTPVDRRAVDAMIPYLTEHHGNPSSGHAAGRAMKAGVNKAREQLAALLGTSPDRIVFTSGGSESNNTVLKGVYEKNKSKSCHIITTAVEHPAVLVPCAFLERNGCTITKVPVDGTGLVNPDDVKKALTADTILITVMHANNEVGTIQPIAEIARIAHEAGVLMHTDAAQTVGKIPTRVDDLGVDFLSLAGHKLYAPAGIGAMFIRSDDTLEPLIHGAGHEGGRRAGTEPVPSIVALGVAAEIALQDMHEERLHTLRDKLHDLLTDALGDGVRLNGHRDLRLPNTLNVGFKGQIGPDLLTRLTGVAASPGAACHFDRHEPSPVLTAMNVPDPFALGAVRFSLGRPTSEDEINTAAHHVIDTVRSASL